MFTFVIGFTRNTELSIGTVWTAALLFAPHVWKLYKKAIHVLIASVCVEQVAGDLLG